MKRLTAALFVFGVAAVTAWFPTAPRFVDQETLRAIDEPADASAGRIVFFESGCESCHVSPGQSDPMKLGGGMALATPFGTFYPPNISPDPRDGIGEWTAGRFANALLEGVSPNGEHYYPAFPYSSYRRLKAVDVRDLFAFLKTLAPVAGRAPKTNLAFPLNIRRAVGVWKRLYLADEAAPKSNWALGEYIVNGPGHCGECHSPRGWLGGIIAGKSLTGAPMMDGKGKAPDLTSKGLKDWSKADIVEALSSGFTPSGDSLGGAMAAVVRNTSQLPKDRLEAIADYLKSL